MRGPVCGRCGLPTAVEVPVCGACKNVDSAFETARAPLRYEGVGKEIVHALKYRGYTPVVEKLAVPLLAEAVFGGRFDAVVPVPLHRAGSGGAASTRPRCSPAASRAG